MFLCLSRHSLCKYALKDEGWGKENKKSVQRELACLISNSAFLLWSNLKKGKRKGKKNPVSEVHSHSTVASFYVFNECHLLNLSIGCQKFHPFINL